jgi:hypothetical protein
MNSKRNGLIDSFRVIASLLVIMIHTGPHPLIIEPIRQLAVPFFFIITAYYVFSSDNPQLASRKTVNSTFLLWGIWTLIKAPLSIYYIYEKGGNIFGYMIGLLLGGTPFFGEMWYLWALLLALPVSVWLSKYPKVFYCFASLLFVVYRIYMYYRQNPTVDMQNSKLWSFYYWKMTAPYAIIWMAVGYKLANIDIDNIKSRWLGLGFIVSFAMVYVEWLVFSTHPAVSVAMVAAVMIGFMLMIKKAVPMRSEHSRICSRLSLNMYMIHMIVIFAFMKMEIILGSYINYVVVVAGTVIVSLILMTFQKRYQTN